ncbi:MAG: histidine kinase [Acidobacteriota bacterium]
MPPHRRTLAVLLVAFASTLAGLYFATQLRLAYPESLRQPWGKALLLNLVHYWIWGALVPFVVWLARRASFENRGWRAIPIHAIASVVVTAVQLVAGVAVLTLLVRDPLLWDGLPRFFRLNFHSSLPTYWLILFVYWAWDYAGRAARLKASLAQARLDALKSQLNPHFLFNTLNSISSLMYTDIEAADRMMARLSELLRSTIHNNGAQEVTLREELEFVGRYLEIEKIRFEERLRISLGVEEEALDGLVPTFSLQPLVENALKHGIAPLERGSSLEIAGRRVDGYLVVRISDGGVGAPAAPLREGVGLANTRSRLEHLYGAAATLRTGNADGGGFFVQLDIPWRTLERVHS